MPVFEYRCTDCSTKYEVLVKSTDHEPEITCPQCNSTHQTKLFSSFSAKVSSGAAFEGGCADGACGMNPMGGCPSGMCGMN